MDDLTMEELLDVVYYCLNRLFDGCPVSQVDGEVVDGLTYAELTGTLMVVRELIKDLLQARTIQAYTDNLPSRKRRNLTGHAVGKKPKQSNDSDVGKALRILSSDLAVGLRQGLVSDNRLMGREPSNVTDGLFSIADSINNLCDAVRDRF